MNSFHMWLKNKNTHDNITDSRGVVTFEEAGGERVMGMSLCNVFLLSNKNKVLDQENRAKKKKSQKHLLSLNCAPCGCYIIVSVGLHNFIQKM